MDYSVILAEISANQMEILTFLKLIDNGLNCLILIFTIFVITMYIRLIIKH
jgi:hypothetical protein